MIQPLQSQPIKVQVAGEVYTVGQKLGEGAFGVLYKVKNDRTSKEYALKYIFYVSLIERPFVMLSAKLPQ